MLVQKLEIMKYRNIWIDLDMADGFKGYDGKYDVDIMIGDDYYDDIVKAEKIKVDEGLYLMNSTLGWMFSGRTIGEKCEDVELLFTVGISIYSCGQNKRECGGPYTFQIIHSAIL